MNNLHYVVPHLVHRLHNSCGNHKEIVLLGMENKGGKLALVDVVQAQPLAMSFILKRSDISVTG